LPKVHIWSNEARSANHFTIANRRLFLCIDVNCLCIPGMNTIRELSQDVDYFLSLLFCSHNGRPG
jgi:hypothetical protein